MMVCMFVISMAYIEPTKVQASTSRKTYTIDVGETLDLSCIVPSCTTRVKTSDSSVASVGNIDFSLANGGWKGDFTVTGRSEGTVIVTVCGVFNNTTYETYIINVKHSFDEGVLVTTADCVTDGEKVYTCYGCAYTKVVNLGKNHEVHAGKAVLNNVKEPSCDDGYRVDKCTTCEVTKNKVVIRKVNNISLSKVAYEYTNKEIKPSVIIKDSAKKAISNSQYNVSYKNNKNVGTATVIINFKGNYSGTVTKTFKINPKATTLNKLTASSKGFTVAWKKQNQQTDGYQIQYATDKSFKRNVGTVSVNKNSATSQKVTKLKPKTKYYVRIRTFKKVNGSMFYSDWKTYSKVVTTNK